MTMELRDLMPKGDVKGGSPKSPYPPMQVSEISESKSNGFSRVAGIIISILSTALIGMTVAWWTALGERGVTRPEMEHYVLTAVTGAIASEAKVSRADMEEYVRTYSPYVMDKAGIAEHQSNQDKEIARVGAVQADVLRRLDKLESSHK